MAASDRPLARGKRRAIQLPIAGLRKLGVLRGTPIVGLAHP